MNANPELPGEVVSEARHSPVARSRSLCQWVADLLRAKLGRHHPDRKSLSERLGDPLTAHRDFELPDRHAEGDRPLPSP